MRIRAKVGTVRVKLDFAGKAQRAAVMATQMVAPELNAAFQDAMGSPVWQWPRETVRRGSLDSQGRRGPGYRVFSPRNIVDQGRLRQSNEYRITGLLIVFMWTEPYAAAVHYGAEIHPWGDKTKEKVKLPARPWTDAVLGTIVNPGIEPYPIALQWKAAFTSAWRKIK